MTINDLIRHMARFYTDWHVKHDLSCVLDACPDDSTRAVVREYAKARRQAPGWHPVSHEAGKARNSHKGIPADELRRIEATATSTSLCVTCGVSFAAKRRDARFCSTRCRVRARRLGERGIVVGRVVRGTDPCPHGSTLGDCGLVWCKARLSDLARGYSYPVPHAPESLHEGRAERVTDNGVLRVPRVIA